MPRFIVRPRQGSQDTSGVEGAGGTVVYSETASKARELGAAKLGRHPSQVEVIEHDDAPSVIGGEDRPLTREEAQEIFNQGASVVPGSWESV